MKNWMYKKGDIAITTTSDNPENVDGENVVLYVDDVNPEVIEEVVNIYNTSKDTKQIDTYLLNEDKCNQDEREFIMENIVNYVNFIETMENQNQNEQFPNNLDEVVEREPITNEGITISIPGFATEPGSPAVSTTSEKEKRTYQRKTVDSKPTSKVQSAEDFIKVMQEKIEMAKMLDSITLPEISGSMTKSNRDIMVEFAKEHAAMILKYMQKIQQA